MATLSQCQEHKLRLESSPDDGRDEVRARLLNYMERAGLAEGDFAGRIGYSRETLRKFISDRFHFVAGSSKNICRAINECIAANPIAPETAVFGELYETANVRTMRQTFQALLRKPVAYMIYAPPGSQKSFVLEHLVAQLNREESRKSAPAQAAYYVYALSQMTPSQLMKAVAIACGTSSAGDRMRIARNLAHDFQGHRVLLVIDEAQHLSINAFETLRILLDRPPHFSLCFAGSHDLKQTFDKFSATLEQWNSRIVDKVRLPGVKEDEAEGIIIREIGELLKASTPDGARKRIRALIAGSTVKDGFEKDRRYINVRTLTNALEQIKLQAEAAKDE
jgi:type II secretory pathway predicted ATPase ExeA